MRSVAVIGLGRFGSALARELEEEGVEVTDDDFDQEIASIAQRVGMQSDAVANYLEDGDRRSRTEGRLYRAKALAVIMDNAKVKDKEVKREELEAQEDANDE